MTLHRFKITSKDSGKTLLLFLTGRIRGMTPQRLQVALHKGFIEVNGQVCQTDLALSLRDAIAVETGYFEKPRIFPEDIPLQILDEDDHILVLHKPPGMACHAGLGTYRGTLLNALAKYFKEKGEPVLENGLVHRLDKASSGLMVVAKTGLAFQTLKKQLLNQTLKRRYYVGAAKPLATEAGSIHLPIGRNPENSIQIEAREDGKPAVTYYTLWKEEPGCFVYSCETVFGRTHQLRIHFSASGSPLIGDTRYGGNPASRLFLCSSGLSFIHPEKGLSMDFQLEKPDFL